MLIDITGSRCISCTRYTQYYANRMTRGGQEMIAVDCGHCGQFQRTTRPGSRCRHYQEKSNVGAFYRLAEAPKTTENPRP